MPRRAASQPPSGPPPHARMVGRLTWLQYLRRESARARFAALNSREPLALAVAAAVAAAAASLLPLLRIL